MLAYAANTLVADRRSRTWRPSSVEPLPPGSALLAASARLRSRAPVIPRHPLPFLLGSHRRGSRFDSETPTNSIFVSTSRCTVPLLWPRVAATVASNALCASLAIVASMPTFASLIGPVFDSSLIARVEGCSVCFRYDSLAGHVKSGDGCLGIRRGCSRRTRGPSDCCLVWRPAEVVRIEGAAEILAEDATPVPPKASASLRLRDVIEVFDRALERMGGRRTRRHCWFAANV